MLKLFVWPLLVSLVYFYNLFYFRFRYQGEDLGLGLALGMFLNILLISSLILYVPLEIIYVISQRSRRKSISLLTSLGLGVASFFLTFSVLSLLSYLGGLR